MSDDAQSTDKVPQVTPEMLRNTHDLAAQAALRAQQMMRKSAEQKSTVIPPDVPARGEGTKAPEIPPKRQSLKKTAVTENAQKPLQKPPPPLPQKPMSAQNSPQPIPKFPPNEILRHSPQLNMRPQGAPQMQQKIQSGSPQVVPKFIDKIPNSPQLGFRNSPQLNQRPTIPSASTGSSPQLGTKVNSKVAAKVMSPSEDFSSVDALRGIESGLRNMERAMQEQMNMRSMEAANQQNLENMCFNPIEFKGNIRTIGSLSSLDGNSPNMRAIENARLSMNMNNMRSIERGFSMDQMRLENLHHGGSGGGGGGSGVGVVGVPGIRSMESNPNIRSAIEEMKMKGMVDHNVRQPVEHHMRSLDRNLPLELQYSRHRQHEAVDFRDQLRQLANSGGMMQRQSAGGLSREDLRMRRRSSHDENQISQGVPGKLLLFFLFLV